MAGGAIELGDIARHTRLLAVRCGRCPRAGTLSLARLIARYGPNASIGDATADLAAGCPNRDGPIYVACDVHFPELPTWFCYHHSPAPASRERGVTRTGLG